MDERETKLPMWAKELIADLRKKLTTATEPLSRELSTLRPRIELLKRRNEALTELLECAARSGHETSAKIVEMIEAYGFSKSGQLDQEYIPKIFQK